MGMKRDFYLEERTSLHGTESKVLRKIFGPEKDEVRQQFRILNNEQLRDFHRSPIIVRTVKSKRGREGMHTEFLWGKPIGKRSLGKPRGR
jgi:hypothetical protein